MLKNNNQATKEVNDKNILMAEEYRIESGPGNPAVPVDRHRGDGLSYS